MAILLTGLWFARIAPAAALLLVPYFLWVTFASVLNFSIWQMNA
jgi:tryptophan-rich sensory protein